MVTPNHSQPLRRYFMKKTLMLTLLLLGLFALPSTAYADYK